MTLAATQIEQVLEARFSGVRFGRYNCRTISGSTTYSQHAWPGGNARDIYAPEDSDDPMGFLDEVNTWLSWNTEALSIRLILWRVKDHYGHMHVDFWPHGYQVPPCAGGDEKYQYSSGQIVSEVNPDPENGYYQEPIEEESMFVKQGDMSTMVEYWQNHLAYLAGADVSQSSTVYLPALSPPLAVGLYDAAMATHVAPFNTGGSGVGIGPGEAMRILAAAYEKGGTA